MATVNHKKAICAEQVTAFRGIDASSPIGDGDFAYDMKNFKILADGSLQKRGGYRTLASLGAAVRGFGFAWDGGEEVILAAVGRSLYRIALTGGDVRSAEVFGTDEGEVVFFEYEGEHYILDGAEIYCYRGGVSATAACGYVPLYGKEWDAHASTNAVNEPLNLLTGRIRLDYKRGDAVSYLPVGIPIQSVDRAFRNGVEIDASGFKPSSGNQISLGGKVSLPLTIYATIDPAFWHDAILRSAKETAVYDGPDSSRILFYGCDETGHLYVSRAVSEESLAAARVGYPDATALYVPKGNDMQFGNRALNAVERLGSRLFITTPDRIWLTEELDAAFEPPMALRLFARFPGGRVRGCVVSIRSGCPVTLSIDGVFLWEIESDPADGFMLTRLSAPIEPLLDDDYFKHARLLYRATADELWLYRADDPEGRVWVYGCEHKTWTSYTGMAASRMVDAGKGVGFLAGTEICLFDEESTVDECSFGPREIVGFYEGPLMEFGDAEAIKRPVRVFLEADAGAGEIAVMLKDVRLIDEATFRGKREGLTRYEAAVKRSRFGRLSAILRATGKSPQRIFGYCIHAVGRKF